MVALRPAPSAKHGTRYPPRDPVPGPNGASCNKVERLAAKLVDRLTRVNRTVVLVVLCVSLVVIEALVLVRLHAGSALALAPQIAAPAPWGVFHDERWLLVNAGSWVSVVLGGIVMIAVRGALTAVMVKLSWPEAGPQPLSWRRALVRGWSSTVVAAVLLSPCSSLLVAFELAPISDLWLAAIPTALGIALFVHHGPVDCWWLRHPRLRSLGWILVSYIELTIAGALIVTAPRAWVPAIAVMAGLADAWAWRCVIRALARPTRLRWAPVSPVGLAGVVAVTVVAVSAAAAPSSMASIAPHAPASAAAATPVQPKPGHHAAGKPRQVLLVSGYGVRWRGNPISLGPGFKTEEFSYLGTDKHGHPLPYTSAATEAPLPILLQRFRAQVDALAQKSGGHIDIVGESEGSLLATIYLLTTPNPPVDHVVALSPLVRPSGANYPGRGENGAGLLAAWELRGIANATNSLTPMHVSPDSPFIASLGTHGNALRDVFGCPVAGVQQFSIVPMADAVGIPPHALSGIAHETVMALHGTLLVNPVVRYDIARYLDGTASPTAHDNVLASFASAGAAAWQAPPRKLTADPPTAQTCTKATAALQAWLGTAGS